MIGLVAYADTVTSDLPYGTPFRRVFPQPTDPPDILDDPQWITMGCDPTREAVMFKLPEDHPAVGAPFTGKP